MATRSRTSSQKRQKEIARMEKQREKAVKRLERKKGEGQAQSSEEEEAIPGDAVAPPDESAIPLKEQ